VINVVSFFLFNNDYGQSGGKPATTAALSSITESNEETTPAAAIQAESSSQKNRPKNDEQHSDVFIEPIDVNQLKLTNDTECNSEELRAIITEVFLHKNRI
jgi:hypothetical protein